MIDHAVRARGIGGSEIAAILGLDPRRDAYSVWAEKLGLVRRKPPNERMEAGKFLEQGIAHWYAARTHRQVSWCDETTCHPDREWQVATPDALIGIDGPWAPWAGGLDCKNVAFDQRDKWGESGTDAVRCRSTYSANGTATYSTCPGGTWRPASAATNWISTR